MEKNQILQLKPLTDTIYSCDIHVPDWAKYAKAGQFLMIRVFENGERFPLTIVNCTENSITVIFKVIGLSTKLLSQRKENDVLYEVLGPLGKPTILPTSKEVVVIGGGVGNAISYAIAKFYYKSDKSVVYVGGYKNISDVFYVNEIALVSHESIFYVEQQNDQFHVGNVIDGLKKVAETREISHVFCAGPLRMMQAVTNYCEEHDIDVVVSLNPIMVDGIGMCGGCRVEVDHRTQFACVDGPEFDGRRVDFEQLIKRNNTYSPHACVLEKQQ